MISDVLDSVFVSLEGGDNRVSAAGHDSMAVDVDGNTKAGFRSGVFSGQFCLFFNLVNKLLCIEFYVILKTF